MPSKRVFILLWLALLVVLPACPSPVISSDRTVWESTVTGLNNLTFDFTPAPPYYYPWWTSVSTPGYTAGGINITGYQIANGGAQTPFTAGNIPASGAVDDFGSGAILFGRKEDISIYSPGGQPYLLISVPVFTYTAFGLDVMTYVQGSPAQYGKKVDIIVTEKDNAVTSYQIDTLDRTAGRAFFGIYSETGISSVRLTAVQGATIIDNLSYGTAPSIPQEPGGETPEAAMVVMIVSGLVFLAIGKKRFQTAS